MNIDEALDTPAGEAPDPGQGKTPDRRGYDLAYALASAMAPVEERAQGGAGFVDTVTSVGGSILNMLRVPDAMEELGVGAGAMSPAGRVAWGFGITAALAVLLRIKRGGAKRGAEGRTVPGDRRERENMGDGTGAVPGPDTTPGATNSMG